MTTTQDRAPRPPQMPRLLAAAGPALAAHHHQFGAMPEISGPELISALDAAQLSGRGGAGFPAGRKIASVTGGKPAVVANGAEGEPLSSKDAILLTEAPHLVLDGLDLAARAVGADDIFLYLPAHVVAAVTRALDERRAARLDRRQPTVVEAPNTFVAGEESALIRRIEGGPALPRDRTIVTAISGVRGRPTLVNNVETLAHIALIARFGPGWFRSVGDRDDPGSMLVTLSGAVTKSGVVEVPTGTLLAGLIERSGATDPKVVRAVLAGGYHGTWISASAFDTTPASGVGIVHALGRGECGLSRTAAIADYLANESARQCGPCRIGLPRLAHLLDKLAHGRVDNTCIREIHRVVNLVEGRGACRHPDGTARMIRSALEVFSDDIEHHRHRRCAAVDDHLATEATAT
ncbi:NADH-ubiquinone oxidoreductase-F iron-sulfur binding region domain-containing protein [Mycobacterium sp. NPDC048908]|uniref:NADH-ubiquinone oxidoreductase-F iron-sulfur binding region domain-containing protein n=1 Tax=Mycobacterium sp. NPDC048908 TaxID=3364292 RepID=UPI003719FC2C